ncbi:MAG: LysR family transcriptional regulator [Anaeromyxobacter sp.]
MQNMLDWNDLRVALAAHEAGTLSGAAVALGVHQTTAGRRLDALEAALGFPLFLRTASGLVPTGEGAPVLASIAEVAGAFTRFEQGMRVGRPGVRGLVRVATTETTARQLVADAIPALVEAHPELSIELVTGNARVDLARGEAELAVRLTEPDASLVARRLGAVGHGLYASPAYVKAFGPPEADGLAGHRVIAPSRELARGPEATWLAEHARSARRVLLAPNLVTCAAAVAQGIGVCPLPTTVADLHGLTPLRMLPEIPPRPVYLAMHPDARRLARVRVVADAIAIHVRGHVARPRPAG